MKNRDGQMGAVLHFRIDEAKRSQLIEYMEENKIKSFAEIIRRALNHYLASEVIREARAFREEVKNFRSDFSRVGSNLNQIALYFNVNGQVPETDLSRVHAEIRIQFKKLARMLEQIQNGLGNP